MWIQLVIEDLKKINLQPFISREIHYTGNKECKKIILDFRKDKNFRKVPDMISQVYQIFSEHEPDDLKKDPEFMWVIQCCE